MTQYWSLGTDIKATVNEYNLMGLKVDDSGDLEVIGEIIELTDDETFDYWNDNQIDMVKQQVLFALKGAKKFYYIDDNSLTVIMEDGDFLGDQDYGSLAPYVVGRVLDDDIKAMLRYDIEATLSKITTLENINIVKIDIENDMLQIDIEAKLINSNNYINLSVRI